MHLHEELPRLFFFFFMKLSTEKLYLKIYFSAFLENVSPMLHDTHDHGDY